MTTFRETRHPAGILHLPVDVANDYLATGKGRDLQLLARSGEQIARVDDRERRGAQFVHWLEYYAGGRWKSLYPAGLPEDARQHHLAWWRGTAPFAEATGVRDLRYVISTSRSYELATQTALRQQRALERRLIEFSLFGLSTREEITDCVRDLLAVSRGSLHAHALAELLLGEVELISDHPDEAELHLVESISLHRQVAAVAGQVLALQRLADSAVSRGDRGRARKLLRNGLRLGMSSPMAPHLIVRMHEGLVGAAAGDAQLPAVAEGESALVGQVVCPPCSVGFRVEAGKGAGA